MAVDDDKVMFSLQVSRSMLDNLDRIATAAQLSRSDVARRALSLNLERVERSLTATEADACARCPIHCQHEGV